MYFRQVGGTIVILEVQRSSRSEALKEAKMRAELDVSKLPGAYYTLVFLSCLTLGSTTVEIPKAVVQ